jgi:hypothetical protein
MQSSAAEALLTPNSSAAPITPMEAKAKHKKAFFTIWCSRGLAHPFGELPTSKPLCEFAWMAGLLRKMAVRLWALMSYESGNPQSVLRRLARQRPSASVFLATTDNIRDATAQWSLNLRQIAIVEAEMDTDLKRGG